MTGKGRRAWLATSIAIASAMIISSVAFAGSNRGSRDALSVTAPRDTIPATPPSWGTWARPAFGELAIAPDGTIFASDGGNARIYRVSPSGETSVFAGAGPGGYLRWDFVHHLGWVTVGNYGGDGRHPTDALFNFPVGLAFDAAGNLLVADHGNDRIRMIGTDGFVSTVAGVGPGGRNYGPWTEGPGAEAGDGGPAVHGILDEPWGITFDGSGNLFIADRDHHAIREVDTNGVLTTVAGTGRHGFNGDGIEATKAKLNRPLAVAFDAAGRMYISDENNFRIRRVSRSGIISTVAGNGHRGCGGDGGLAVDASFRDPGDIVIAPDGSLLITDGECARVRRVAPDGTISTVAGNGRPGCGGVGGPLSELRVGGGGLSLRYAPSGELYLVDCYKIIRVDGSGTTQLVATAPTLAELRDAATRAPR